MRHMQSMRQPIALAIGLLIFSGTTTAVFAQSQNARQGPRAQTERLTADGKYRIVRVGGRWVRQPVHELDGILPGFRVPHHAEPSARRAAASARTPRSHRPRRATSSEPAPTVHRASLARAVPEPSMFGSYSPSALVAEARRYLGTNPTKRARLWCARFVNFVLAKVGYEGTGSDAAKSFVSYGRRISGPRIGAIAVLTRKGGGHVGIVTGIDRNGNPILIAGNNGKRQVGISVYPKRRVIAYVVPDERRAGATSQVASSSR